MMEVINSEACEIDRNKGLSFYTPTSAMNNILKLKKKSKQDPYILRALHTVYNDLSNSRDILHCDARNPSGDSVLNQCLAIVERSVGIEQDLTSFH